MTRIGSYTGGTFTDLVGYVDGRIVTSKTSTVPADPTLGISRSLELAKCDTQAILFRPAARIAWPADVLQRWPFKQHAPRHAPANAIGQRPAQRGVLAAADFASALALRLIG